MSLPIAARSPGAGGHHAGILYSYRNDAIAPTCSWSFWLLNKSKKVWFRLDERHRGRMIVPSFFYRGERIVYRGDLEPGAINARSEVGVQTIVWGQHVSNDWGKGPQGTNYYLNLWTRWSIFQPACCHPDHFSMSYRLAHPH
jgi:hypothetical protein